MLRLMSGRSGCADDPVVATRRSVGQKDGQEVSRSSESSRTVRCDESRWRNPRHNVSNDGRSDNHTR